MTQTSLPARATLVALSLCATATMAQDQARPFYVGAAQAFTYDSNLFRARKGPSEVDDVISTTSLLAGISRPFGRQRLFGDLAIRHNNYQDASQLNNTGHELKVGVDWETVGRLSGTVSYSHNESQALFGDDDGPVITDRENTEKSQEFLARALLGAQARLGLEAIYVHRRLDYSAQEYEFKELQQDSLSLGVLYRPSGLLTLGAAIRGTRGEYPYASATTPRKDEFDRRDIDLTAAWTPSGLSTLSARLSFSKEEHDLIGSRDFSGTTGALSWEYKPTGKLTFLTELIRDTGAESGFNNSQGGSQATQVGNTSRISEALQLRALYEATAKIALNAEGRYERRDLVTNGPTSTDAGEDKTAQLSLGIRYAPTYNWTLGCSVGYVKRSASSSVSYGYDANTASCLAKFLIQ